LLNEYLEVLCHPKFDKYFITKQRQEFLEIVVANAILFKPLETINIPDQAYGGEQWAPQIWNCCRAKYAGASLFKISLDCSRIESFKSVSIYTTTTTGKTPQR